MKEVFLYLMSVCPDPQMVNKTEYPWNDHDKQILATSKRRCGEIYQNSPCVKIFVKWGERDYSVTCGKAD